MVVDGYLGFFQIWLEIMKNYIYNVNLIIFGLIQRIF